MNVHSICRTKLIKPHTEEYFMVVRLAFIDQKNTYIKKMTVTAAVAAVERVMVDSYNTAAREVWQ